MSSRLKHLPAASIIMIALLMPVWAFGQGAQVDRKDSARTSQPAETPAVITGLRYQNGNRKDPFLNPVLLKKQSEFKLKVDDEEEPPGQPPPGIAGMYIAQVMLLGISTSEGKKTAVFRGTDKRAYFLQDGDRVFDGYLKKIGTDDVLMIRETRLRSGKVLTQEVPKRLRTP